MALFYYIRRINITRTITWYPSFMWCGGWLLALLGVVGCAVAPVVPSTNPEVVGEIDTTRGYVFGYLTDSIPAVLFRHHLPNSVAILPPPPTPDSVQQRADEAGWQSFLSLRGTPRYQLARADANLVALAPAQAFACALGLPISQAHTPHLAMLLRRTLTDAGLATYAAKYHYKRTRPFIGTGQPTCTPEEEGALARDGSYPSGHAAIGWALALVLAEVAPERAPELLARGWAFGHSRVVCGVHWLSDIAAGQAVAEATVAALRGNAHFLAQLNAAKAEVAAARAQGGLAVLDCALERAALHPLAWPMTQGQPPHRNHNSDTDQPVPP